jgi:hypothetical protein
MKHVLAALSIYALLCQGAQAQSITTSQCASLAQGIQSVAANMSTMLSALEQVPPLDDMAPKFASNARLKTAAAAHDPAKRNLVASLRRYKAVLEDLGYQLIVCGR